MVLPVTAFSPYFRYDYSLLPTYPICSGRCLMHVGKKVMTLLAIVAGGAICGPALAQTTAADAPGQSPLKLIARPFSVAYGLGEPVFVELQIVNTSSGPASVDLGGDGTANLRVTIREPGGRSEVVQLPSGGLRAPGKHLLGANTTYNQRLLLSEWHEFRDIGGYAVNVALAPAFGSKEAAPPPAYLNVSIGPRDESKLRAVAKVFADRAIDGRDYGVHSEAALDLSYVADPVAIPEMARVLASSDAGLKLTTAVARMGGPAAIDALQAAQSNPDKWIRLDAARELQALREGKQVVFAVSD